MIIIVIIIILYFPFIPQNSNPKIYCSPQRNSPVSFLLTLTLLTQLPLITWALCQLCNPLATDLSASLLSSMKQG